MNKLFSKLGTLLLGASLVVAGGVAVSGKKASEVKATEQNFYTLDGTTTGGSSGYADESDITQGDYSWKVTGNTTMNPWRIGGKSLTAVDRPAYSTTVMSETVTKIEVSLGAMSSITLNSLTLIVASDSDFANQIDTKSATPTASSVTTFEPSTGKTWANAFYKFVFNVTVSGSSNKFVAFNYAKFYKESSNPRGDISIDDYGTPILSIGSYKDLTYTWTPASGSSATISSYSWVSSDSDVLSVSGNRITAVAPGAVTVTLNATDSIGEEYSVVTGKIFVTNEYPFAVGDNVALYSEGALMELESLNKSGSNHYGAGVAYTGTPNGTYLLNVEEGSVTGSFAFKNGDDYLSWTSGNTLTSSTTKNDNSSWYVVVYDSYMIISNVATPTREIWWNSGNPRFACYEGKTPTTTGYNSVSLIKIEEAPVRGTIQILNDFGTFARKGFNTELLYEFTPADGDSATITSNTWTSSNTDVVTINGDSCSGVGPGKAKITLNATDSNGQEYTVSTADFTVVDVVSGTYVKKTSVNAGDTVVIVCGTAGTQMVNIADSYGAFVYFDVKPAAICEFVLEAGNAEGSYALKHEDKYLNWISGTGISFVDTKSDNSSWTIEFNEDGDATIACVALDGDSHRYIAWNNNSPRFAAYKSGQSAIQLYGPDTPEVYGATEFANELISMTNDYCAAYEGETKTYAELKDLYATVWSTLSGADHYGKLSDTDIGLLVNADAKESSEDPIEVAMYRYDLISAKYALDGFITDRPAAAFSIYSPAYQSNIDSSSSTTIIVIVAVASMTLLGVTLVLRKRKHQ